LFSALDFCFPWSLANSFKQWLDRSGLPPIEYDSVKAALVWLYAERNKIVHELSDRTAAAFGSEANVQSFNANAEKITTFMTFIQAMKLDHFSSDNFEDHPSWGGTARKVNQANRRIKKLLATIDEFLSPLSEEDHHVEFCKKYFTRVLYSYEEYINSITLFAAYSHGPGTIANDIALGVNLRAVREFQRLLKSSFELMKFAYGLGVNTSEVRHGSS
jgi:hypothetical protein